jgi:hypothetical protein
MSNDEIKKSKRKKKKNDVQPTLTFQTHDLSY